MIKDLRALRTEGIARAQKRLDAALDQTSAINYGMAPVQQCWDLRYGSTGARGLRL